MFVPHDTLEIRRAEIAQLPIEPIEVELHRQAPRVITGAEDQRRRDGAGQQREAQSKGVHAFAASRLTARAR